MACGLCITVVYCRPLHSLLCFGEPLPDGLRHKQILNRHAFSNHGLAKSQDFGTPMSPCEVCFQIFRRHWSSSGLKLHWTLAFLLNFVFLSALALILSWKSYIVPNRGLKEPSLLREKVKGQKNPIQTLTWVLFRLIVVLPSSYPKPSVGIHEVNRALAVPYVNLVFICQPQSGWLFELYRKPLSEMGAICLLPISDAHPRGTPWSYR